MAQKPLLWVEAGAHAVRKKRRSECNGGIWVGEGVAWHLRVCVVFEASSAVWRCQLSLCILVQVYLNFGSGVSRLFVNHSCEMEHLNKTNQLCGETMYPHKLSANMVFFPPPA